MLDNIIEINNQKYRINRFYKDNDLCFDFAECYKLINENLEIRIGIAFYDNIFKIVRCKIDYYELLNNYYIDIDKEKEDFTKVLNIVKKEMLEYNNKEE